MNKVIRISIYIFSLCFILLSCYSETKSQSKAQFVYQKNSKSVVVIVTYDQNGKILSQGSGCQLNKEGIIVTNYHVLRGAFDAVVIFDDDVEYQAKYVCAYDKEHDLALLKHYGKRNDHVIVTSSDDIEIGQECFAIGSPKGFQNTISGGIISNILKESSEYYFQISNPISPGSSGGGLFNESGDLIGITFATFKEGQNINFAIPSKYLSDLLLKKFELITLSEFQVIIGSSTIITQKKKGNDVKKEPPPKNSKKEPEYIENQTLSTVPDFSYDIGGRYIFMSTVLNEVMPDFVEFRKGFSATFSYWFSSNGGLGITYQKQEILEKFTDSRIDMHLYKGELLFRTSEKPLRVVMGFGIGLANTYFRVTEGNDKLTIGKSDNQLNASALLGIEIMFFNRLAVSANLPFDYILVDDKAKKDFFYVSPSIGFNLVF